MLNLTPASSQAVFLTAAPALALSRIVPSDTGATAHVGTEGHGCCRGWQLSQGQPAFVAQLRRAENLTRNKSNRQRMYAGRQWPSEKNLNHLLKYSNYRFEVHVTHLMTLFTVCVYI